MPNFDPWAQLRLLDLQALDHKLDALAKRLRELPERNAAIAALHALDDARTAHGVAVTEAADIAIEVNKAELDVEAVRDRSAKDQGLLDSGAIKDSKQLTDLQHEIATLARRQAELEEIELEILARQEAAQSLVAELAAALAQADGDALAAAQHARAAEDEMLEQQDALNAERKVEADALPAELLALYEKIRKDNNGTGAAHLQHGRCGGCRLQLTPVALNAARSASPDAIVRCEECRAILVRNAESGL